MSPSQVGILSQGASGSELALTSSRIVCAALVQFWAMMISPSTETPLPFSSWPPRKAAQSRLWRVLRFGHDSQTGNRFSDIETRLPKRDIVCF